MEKAEEENLTIIEQFNLERPIALWKSLGLYDDEFLKEINTHWLKFKPEKQYVYYSFAVFYTILAVIGLSGNGLIIYVFARCKPLRTPPNCLILNLAISDFLMLAKAHIFILNSIYQGPATGSKGCQIYGFVGGLSGTASIMNLLFISVDRYFAIVHPLTLATKLTFKKAIAVNIFIWSYAIFFSSIPLFRFFKTDYTAEGLLTSCSFNYLNKDRESRVFILTFFFAAYVLPLLVILFCYWRICLAVKNAKKALILLRSKSGRRRDSIRVRQNTDRIGYCETELKIVKLAVKIIFLWIFAWSPYAFISLLGITGYEEYLTPLRSSVPAVLCKIASCINPFLYFLNHSKFQEEFQNRFTCCVRRRQGRGDEQDLNMAELCNSKDTVNVECKIEETEV